MPTYDETRGGAPLPSARPAGGEQYFDAKAATDLLHQALTAAGLADAFPELRADLDPNGAAVVRLGRTDPETVARIAKLLEAGRSTTAPPSITGDNREDDHS